MKRLILAFLGAIVGIVVWLGVSLLWLAFAFGLDFAYRMLYRESETLYAAAVCWFLVVLPAIIICAPIGGLIGGVAYQRRRIVTDAIALMLGIIVGCVLYAFTTTSVQLGVRELLDRAYDLMFRAGLEPSLRNMIIAGIGASLLTTLIAARSAHGFANRLEKFVQRKRETAGSD